MGGIPKQTTREEVFAYIKKFGKLKYFALPYTKEDKDSHKGFAKALFESPEDAAAFLHYSNHAICGTSIGVSEWVPKNQHISKKEVPSENKLFFKFKSIIAERDLVPYFSQFGKVSSIEIKFNYKTNQIRDFGFVIFECSKSTQKVLKAGHSHMVAGKGILVYSSKSNKDLITEKQSSTMPTHANFSRYNLTSRPSGNQLTPEFSLGRSIFRNSLESSSSLKQNSACYSDNYPEERRHANKAEQSRINFIKPTSKRWHHNAVSIRHKNPSILLFKLVAVQGDQT